MADKDRSERIDPTWPSWSEEDHPVSELTSAVQGASSPYGEVEFPSEKVPYVHPTTEINK
ncbi:MAG: hypothetical protein GEV09_21645 [Pseudonocardiaceae bacterium]|nr:hypothetical protein [Pseudonocardiaceae bacterium]